MIGAHEYFAVFSLVSATTGPGIDDLLMTTKGLESTYPLLRVRVELYYTIWCICLRYNQQETLARNPHPEVSSVQQLPSSAFAGSRLVAFNQMIAGYVFLIKVVLITNNGTR